MEIVETSKSFNAKNKITGCLFYYKGQFVQILEGDKEKIQELYLKILKDNRHYNIKLLYEYEKNERIFKDWSMAFLRFDSVKLQKLNKQLFQENLSFFSEFNMQPKLATKLFWKKVRQIIKT